MWGSGDRRTKREPSPYICDFSRGGLNVCVEALASKPCSEATDIGDRLSFGSDCSNPTNPQSNRKMYSGCVLVEFNETK